MKQTANHILLVKPKRFFSNPETAVNNYFQEGNQGGDLDQASSKALLEFDGFEKMLFEAGVKVTVWDAENPDTPDALFPNNWIVTGGGKNLYLMPMYAENRRKERSEKLVKHLRQSCGYGEIIDFSHFEKEGKYFEGTGSAVIHWPSKTAYIARSERSDEKTAESICASMGLRPFFFSAYQTVEEASHTAKNGVSEEASEKVRQGTSHVFAKVSSSQDEEVTNGEVKEFTRKLIYHTNVVMSIGDGFVVACLSAIDDEEERSNLVRSFEERSLEIIEIDERQMENFCGNILQVETLKGEKMTVMSKRAYQAFDAGQLSRLSNYGKVIHAPLTVIEKLGGGGARCMMAELF